MRQEALAIALRLRQALEDGPKAALMTPDRRLARHVGAALDRWDIVPDDSAGLPLQLSPPGRFLRQVAQLMAQPLTTSRLLSLLQHPLCHSGAARPTHLRRALCGKLGGFPSDAVLRRRFTSLGQRELSLGECGLASSWGRSLTYEQGRTVAMN